ncbi:MAG: ABC transporter permease [Bacilli bacterium]
MFSFKIAYRFLISNKPQLMLIVLGIGVGLAVQIFIGSLIMGLQASLLNNTIGNQPHILIKSELKNTKISEDTTYEISDSSLITSQNKSLENNALVTQEGANYPVFFKAIEFPQGDEIYQLKQRLVAGELPLQENEIVIGKQLFQDLKLKLNDNLVISSPSSKEFTLKVVGYVDYQVAILNETWLISNLKTGQTIFNNEGEISALELQVKDIFQAQTIAQTMSSKEKIISWQESNQQLLSALKGQSISSYMIQVFVVISVVLGIASVLIISVVSKQKQIGILKAMGLSDLGASLIFIAQGFMLGILGASAGLLLGFALIKSFLTFAINSDGTSVVPIMLDASFIITSYIVAVLVAMIASIIPSLNTWRLSVMEVINNG